MRYLKSVIKWAVDYNSVLHNIHLGGGARLQSSQAVRCTMRAPWIAYRVHMPDSGGVELSHDLTSIGNTSRKEMEPTG